MADPFVERPRPKAVDVVTMVMMSLSQFLWDSGRIYHQVHVSIVVWCARM